MGCGVSTSFGDQLTHSNLLEVEKKYQQSSVSNSTVSDWVAHTMESMDSSLDPSATYMKSHAGKSVRSLSTLSTKSATTNTAEGQSEAATLKK